MKLLRLWTFGWITVQSCLLATVTPEPLPPLIACLLAVCALRKPRTNNPSHRRSFAIIGVLVGLYAASRIGLLLYREPMELPWSSSLISVVAELCLVWQLWLIWRNDRWPRYGSELIACGTVAIAAAFWHVMATERQEELLVLSIAIVLFIIVYAARVRSVANKTTTENGRYGRRLEVASFGLVFLISWPVADQMSRRFQDLQTWISNRVALNVTAAQPIRSYVRVGNLRSVLGAQMHNPAQVAVRVFADQRPGYLRGRVYDTYLDGEWYIGTRQQSRRQDRIRREQVLEPNARLPEGIASLEAGQRLFSVADSARGPWHRLEIWNDPARGDVFFLPLDTAHIVGNGEYLAMDRHNAVHGGISTQDPYLAYATTAALRTPLSPRDRMTLTTLPPNTDPRITELAQEIRQDQEHVRDKIRSVTRFFQTQFRYSLKGFSIPPRVDPITFFLVERPPAHCEFFATATVILLRQMGVPCRYVTGYVVQEESEYGDYWIGRNLNAHAWVEAYDDETQSWQVVESTPGMSFEDIRWSAGLAGEVEVRRGDRFRQAIQLGRYWLEPRWRNTWLIAAAGWLRGPTLTVLFVAGLVWFLRRGAGWHFWRRNQIHSRSASHHVLRQVDTALHKYGLHRGSSETLHQFAERVRDANPNDHVLQQAASWYEAYAAHRYGREGLLPETDVFLKPVFIGFSRTRLLRHRPS